VTSKDGSTTLTVTSQDTVAFEEVIERSPNVSSVAQVTKLEGAKIPGAFSVSPDGETVVFQALELQPAVLINLWSASTRGTGGLSRITAGNYLDSGPSFSSDGARLYFASNRNSVLPRIWSIKATGAGGISKGLELAGFEGVCGLDWFPEAGKTYRRNFHHPFVEGDICLPEKKAEFFDWLRDNGRGDLLQENINPSTLKATVKGLVKNGEEIPEDLLNVSPFTRASITKT
jgi:hypothetical protein